MAREVNVYTTRTTDKRTGDVTVTVRFEADRVMKPVRSTVWPGAFATYWAALDAAEREELAERLTLDYVRQKVDKIDAVAVAVEP